MTNLKKRVKKGIDSLEEQINLHEEKLKQAEESNMEELAKYYQNEIASLKKRKANRESIFSK